MSRFEITMLVMASAWLAWFAVFSLIELRYRRSCARRYRALMDEIDSRLKRDGLDYVLDDYVRRKIKEESENGR